MLSPALRKALQQGIRRAIDATEELCREKPILTHKERVGMFVTALRTQMNYEDAWTALDKNIRKRYARYLFSTDFWTDVGITKWHGLV